MESSTSHDRFGGFLNSPRAQRRLIWISGGFFAVALIVFLSVFVLRGSPGPTSPISKQPAQTAAPQVKAPADPKAFKVARTFLETAVLRKNLDAAYPLVNDEIKGGMTKKQWDKGTIVPGVLYLHVEHILRRARAARARSKGVRADAPHCHDRARG